MFGPDGKTLASGSPDNFVLLWSIPQLDDPVSFVANPSGNPSLATSGKASCRRALSTARSARRPAPRTDCAQTSRSTQKIKELVSGIRCRYMALNSEAVLPSKQPRREFSMTSHDGSLNDRQPLALAHLKPPVGLVPRSGVRPNSLRASNSLPPPSCWRNEVPFGFWSSRSWSDVAKGRADCAYTDRLANRDTETF
jgi:hypothetical protein